MVVKWIDKRSVLRLGKKVIKAGDIIPAGALSQERLDYFKSRKKIQTDEPKPEKVIKEKTVLNVPVKVQVIEPEPIPEPEPTPEPEPEKPKRGPRNRYAGPSFDESEDTDDSTNG